jgi:hypothetical protein
MFFGPPRAAAASSETAAHVATSARTAANVQDAMAKLPLVKPIKLKPQRRTPGVWPCRSPLMTRPASRAVALALALLLMLLADALAMDVSGMWRHRGAGRHRRRHKPAAADASDTTNDVELERLAKEVLVDEEATSTFMLHKWEPQPAELSGARCVSVIDTLKRAFSSLNASEREARWRVAHKTPLDLYGVSLGLFYNDMVSKRHTHYSKWRFNSDKTLTFLLGDATINNFGALTDAAGVAHMDVLRTDEVWVADYQLDVWRLGVDIVLHADAAKVPLAQQHALLVSRRHSHRDN